MSEKFSSTLRGASLIVIIIGVFGKGFGFLREIVFAAYFGLSSEYDFYLIAITLPTIITTSIGYIIQNYFIPGYLHAVKKSTDAGNSFLSRSLTVSFVISFVITIVLYFSSSLLVYYLFSTTDADVVLLFKISLVLIPCSTIASFLLSYYYSKKDFFNSSLSLLFPNVTTLILVIFGSHMLGVYSIIIGMILGITIQLIYLMINSHTSLFTKFQTSFSILRESGFSSTLFLIILIEITSQLYILIDRYFYTYLSVGGIAAINYANVLFLFPISIFAMAFSTVLFPQFASYYVEKRMDELTDVFLKSISFTIFLFAPIMIIYFFEGEQIVSFLLMRGKFSSQDVTFTFSILKIFSLSLVFYSVYAVLNKMLYGLDGVKFLAVITIAGVLMKIILNSFLIDAYNEEGLAFATTFSFIFFSVSAFIYIHRRLKFKLRSFLIENFSTLFNCVIAYTVVEIISSNLNVGGLMKTILFTLIFISVYLFTSEFIGQTYLKLIKSTLVFRR